LYAIRHFPIFGRGGDFYTVATAFSLSPDHYASIECGFVSLFQDVWRRIRAMLAENNPGFSAATAPSRLGFSPYG
jgi:hypothetical protein